MLKQRERFNADGNMKWLLPAEYGQPEGFHNMGCMHFGAQEFSWDSLEKFCTEWEPKFKKGHEHTVFSGDPFNHSRRFDQKMLSHMEDDGFDASDLHQIHINLANDFHKRTAFMDNHVLCGVASNHEGELPANEDEGRKAMTANEYLVSLYKGKYAGAAGYLFVRLMLPDGWRPVITILVTHLYRGGMTLGGQLNAVDKLRAGFVANIIFCAHTHNPVFGMGGQLQYNSKGVIKNSPTLMCRCGSWLLNYVEKEGNYATAAMYPPAGLAMPHVTVTPMKIKGKRNLRFEYHSGPAWLSE